MKRSILVATVMTTAAGVASANLLTTAPRDVTSSSPRSQLATEAPPADTRNGNDRAGPDNNVRLLPAPPTHTAPPPSHIAPKIVASQTTQKALVEPAQAPVPFRMKPRPPVNVPPVAEAKADKPASEQGDAGSENAARAAIEADGYKGVKVLRKGANGVWHASALRGKTTVMLTVDASGNVSAD